jgi:hypothetical protein
MKEVESVQLTDHAGKRVPLRKGEASIELEPKGTIFDSDLILKTNEGRWKFSIPKAAFSAAQDFEVSEDTLRQPIGLSARWLRAITSRRLETGTQSCEQPVTLGQDLLSQRS